MGAHTKLVLQGFIIVIGKRCSYVHMYIVHTYNFIHHYYEHPISSIMKVEIGEFYENNVHEMLRLSVTEYLNDAI